LILRYLVKEGTAKIEQYRDGRRKDVKVHMFLFNDCILLTKLKKRPERESWVCNCFNSRSIYQYISSTSQ
jgi:hypothetical protein